jgi:hypothetical protein
VGRAGWAVGWFGRWGLKGARKYLVDGSGTGWWSDGDGGMELGTDGERERDVETGSWEVML